MSTNWLEIVNVLVSVALIVAVWQEKKATVLFALFLYGTLHFAYASLALLTHDSTRLLTEIHAYGVGVVGLVSALVVLATSYTLLAVQAYRVVSKDFGAVSVGGPVVLVVSIVLLLAGYYINYRTDDHDQALNVASLVAMLTLLLLVQFNVAEAERNIDKYGLVLLAILLPAVGVAVYEVLASKAWATFWNSDGVIVFRASSFLFNPNLFAYWLSLIYIAIAYAWHEWPERGRLCILAMMLASVGLYMSGSRSGLTLLVAMLMLAAMILRSRKSVYAILYLLITIASIYIISLNFSSSSLLGKLSVLGQRYEMAFVHLYGYVASFVGSSISVPPEVEIAIEGRFVGDTIDAGWLVLFRDAGLLGIFAFIVVIFYLTIKLFRVDKPGSEVARTYAFAALCYCVVSGLVLRFQIFPVWLLFAVIMAVVLTISSLHKEHTA